jgi:transcriptional regulator with GAF, ATPase, and Fis domain
LRDLVIQSLQTGQPHRQVEVKLASQRGPTQSDKYLLVSTAILNWPQGRRILVCLEDITARKQAELDLRKALQYVARLKEQLLRENLALREQFGAVHDSEEILGTSDALKLALENAECVAATDANVLITSETGTGKELIARLIHKRSARRERPLITVNCAALSGYLIESELFGHVKGAFTGAFTDKVGRFELADGGTIFLDEIGELPIELQAKLLLVLQHGQFEQVGSSEPRTVNVRVIAATNRNLHNEMAKGTFRSDLYYRLDVFRIVSPPLRFRREDIPLLVWHFLSEANARVGKTIENVPKATMDALVQYDWPGNIRELRNVVERSVILSPGPTLDLRDALVNPVRPRKPTPGDQKLQSVERDHIVEVLKACQWRVNGNGNAAERLGMKPSTLRSRMKKLGIGRP